MKKLVTVMTLVGVMMLASLAVIFGTETMVYANEANKVPEGCVPASILSNETIGGKKYYCDKGNGEGVVYVLGIVVNVLTFGVGTAATVGLVISGIQYIMAGGDVGRLQRAKMRIFHIVIGLAIYAVFWGILQFLLPGGLFGGES